MTSAAQPDVQFSIIDVVEKTPLMMAFGDGAHLLAQRLLSEGADPNLVDTDGNTALHHVFLVPSPDPRRWMCVAYLLQAGANANATNGSGDTALHLAVRDIVARKADGYRGHVRLMLDHGADLLIPDADGQTPADLLAANPELFGAISSEARAALARRAPEEMESRTASSPAASRSKVRL